MGDMGDTFNEHKQATKELKAKHGIDCPGCREKFPRAIPSKLLPGWKCRTCGHIDTRPLLGRDTCPTCNGKGYIDSSKRVADKIDGYDRDDTGLSPDY